MFQTMIIKDRLPYRLPVFLNLLYHFTLLKFDMFFVIANYIYLSFMQLHTVFSLQSHPLFCFTDFLLPCPYYNKSAKSDNLCCEYYSVGSLFRNDRYKIYCIADNAKLFCQALYFRQHFLNE